MAEPELLEERLISGKGVLKMPADMAKVRTLTLYADLVRPPSNAYKNVNWNPARARFGTITFLRKEYVIADIAIEYERQAFDGINDICGQTLLALKCALQATNQNFEFLAAGLGIDTVVSTNSIKDYENLRLSWDEARIVCYADTSLQLRLYGTKYDVCNEDYNRDQPPPPPTPPKPRVPSKTPIKNLSQPYDKNTNDNNNTEPYQDDEPLPDLADLPTKTFTVKVYGLRTGCLQGEVQFTTVYTAKEIDFETRAVVSGEFQGCAYDFIIIDRVSRYPSTDGGSFPGAQIVTSST